MIKRNIACSSSVHPFIKHCCVSYTACLQYYCMAYLTRGKGKGNYYSHDLDRTWTKEEEVVFMTFCLSCRSYKSLCASLCVNLLPCSADENIAAKQTFATTETVPLLLSRCILERDPVAQKHAARIKKHRGTYDRYGNRKPPAILAEKKTKRWKKRHSSPERGKNATVLVILIKHFPFLRSCALHNMTTFSSERH